MTINTLSRFPTQVKSLFEHSISLNGNLISLPTDLSAENEQQTSEIFSEKWKTFGAQDDSEKLYEFQRQWYLKLYGFENEAQLAKFLRTRSVIIDAGCGMGYKAAWFASLAPECLVLGIDYSDSAYQAAEAYKGIDNLFFIKGDIANTGIKTDTCDYVSCDQVIMHTEDPEATFSELCRITNTSQGQFACYFYAKKALPRELLDDHFRTKCKSMTSEQLWDMAEQLTHLGATLSELNIEINVPDIPALGIKGGKQDLQRFIYWNFVKCFWNPELGHDTSVVTNFDWYSPSNAKRYSQQDVEQLLLDNRMNKVSFHIEEACISGRFSRISEIG